MKGSQRGRDKQVRAGFNIQFPPHQLFRGVHSTIGIDRSGSGDEYSQEEIIVRQIINHAGNLPQIYDDLIHVIAPQDRHTGSAMLNMARYNDVFLDSMYENGSQGTAFEYELIYFPQSTEGGVEGLKRPNPDGVQGTALRDLGDDKEIYRWYFQIENNRQQDDYSQLMEALGILGGRSSSPEFHPEIQRVIAVDEWLRALAVQILAGIGDNYSSGSQHNGIFYARPDGKLVHLPWDMDFSFTQGTNVNLIGNGELRKLISDPGNEHNYYGHVYDILQTTFNRDYMDAWVDHFDALVPGQSHFRGFKNVIGTRANNALSAIERAVDPIAFDVTNASPLDIGDQPTAVVEGSGWVDVRTIRLQGSDIPLEIVWTDENHWQTTLPVNSGTNEYVFEAYDFQGVQNHSASVIITSTAQSPAKDSLRVSEIQYNPAAATGNEVAGDKDDFEFLEFVNVGDSAIDLMGIQLVQVPVDGNDEGIEFTFGNESLAAGERIVVVKNQGTFSSRYGDNVRAASGEFVGRLSNGGETLTVVDANGGLIQQFAYDDAWHPTTDGDGFSLTFVDPTIPSMDAWNQSTNWQPSGNIGGTPGTDNVLIPGDSNMDGIFNSSDLIVVFQAGEYEDNIEGNSTFEEGDWNGDGDFTTADLVAAFAAGHYTEAALIGTSGKNPNEQVDQVAAADLLFGDATAGEDRLEAEVVDPTPLQQRPNVLVNQDVDLIFDAEWNELPMEDSDLETSL